MEAKSKSEHEVLRHFSYQFFLSLIMIITLSTLLLLVMTVIRNSQFYRTSGYIIKYVGEEKSAEGVFEIKELNDSGQDGILFLKTNKDDTTTVFVNTAGSAVDNQPVHFHSGTCDLPGEILFDLKSLTSGISSTTLSEKLTDLQEKELVLVIHKSQEEANTYNSCAELK